jgi:DNA-binding protein HU-beta
VSKTTAAVRARAASTSAATRREVEQSIARFEKRLDDANDALKTLGGHLGRGATGSYKDVTAALTSLRREASKTNKQALKDFDSLRTALTQKTSSRTNSRAKKATSTASKKASSTASKRSTAKSSTAKRSTAKRSTGSRSTGSRARKSS